MHHTKRPHLRPAVALLLMLLPFVALSCSGEDAGTDGLNISDAADDTGAVVFDVTDDTGSAPQDTTPGAIDAGPDQTCPGGADCPCAASDECDSGLCMEGADGNKCARTCVDSCPTGFACAQVPQGSDVLTVCVDKAARLCSPCEQSKDCNHPGVTSARCIAAGAAGNFCGSGCVGDSDCPKAHSCKDATDVDGNTTKQCLPVDSDGKLSACGCSPNAVALALKTTCSKSVALDGKELVCKGNAQCKEAGKPAA